MDPEMTEVADEGEIMDDEFNPELVRQNELEMKAKQLLATRTAPVPLEDSKTAPVGVRPKPSGGQQLPEEMLCVVCYDRRKEIMI